jgi:Putative adhesin Stv domain
MRILVNCHGGRVVGPASPNPAQFNVPAGVTIHFYVNDGALLNDGDAWNILHARQTGAPLPVAPGIAHATVNAGTVCQDYWGVPYNALNIVNGIQVEGPATVFTPILGTGGGQNWGPATAHTVQTENPVLPAVQGGQPYARSAIRLSVIAAYAATRGPVDIDWISCREHW